MEKKEIRKKIISDMSNLDENYIKSSSYIVSNKLIDYLSCYKFKNVIAYRSIGNEIDLSYLFNYIYGNTDIDLYFPKINNKAMDFYRAFDINDFKRGFYNIPEPKSDIVINKEALNSELSLVLIPCIGANAMMYRLGRGGGYYDKYFFEKNYSCKKIGIMYRNNINSDFSNEIHDLKLDDIIYD